MITPRGAMKLAIQEAHKGLGFVAPNPPVGCVILDKDGHLLAKGFHRQYGQDHAEIDALKKVKDPALLKGAVVYVTLEPCAHEGKTGSCAKKLATLPLAKVVYGLKDPFPEVSGKGIEILQQAGIEVAQAQDWHDELEDLPEIFLHNYRQQKTFVAVKVATSLDGQMAHVTGDSKWLTGELAREYVHFLRAHYDAVLVGKNTFLLDDPKLNVRHPQFLGKKNKVIILDAQGEVYSRIAESQVLKCHEPSSVIVVTGPHAGPPPAGVQQLKCELMGGNKINLNTLRQELYKLKIMSVFVEGGASVVSDFLKHNLVQRYYQFIAPQIMGAQTGMNLAKNLAIEHLSQARRLKRVRSQNFGADLLVTGRLDLNEL